MAPFTHHWANTEEAGTLLCGIHAIWQTLKKGKKMEVELKIFLTWQEPSANHFYKKPQNNTSPDVPLISQGLIWEWIIDFNWLTTEQKGTRLWTSAFNHIMDPSLFLLLWTKIILTFYFFFLSPRMNLAVCSAMSEQAITVANLAGSLHLLMSARRKTDNEKKKMLQWNARSERKLTQYCFLSPFIIPNIANSRYIKL